ERALPCWARSSQADDFAAATVGGRDFPAQQLTGVLLRRLKLSAERELGGPIRRAVITVPAHFTDAQPQATLEAARIAGVVAMVDITDRLTGKATGQPMGLLSEPVAVALAATWDRKEPGRVAVVNLGAGHLDVAILDVGDGVFEVKATGGDPTLGGLDFDQAL